MAPGPRGYALFGPMDMHNVASPAPPEESSAAIVAAKS